MSNVTERKATERKLNKCCVRCRTNDVRLAERGETKYPCIDSRCRKYLCTRCFMTLQGSNWCCHTHAAHPFKNKCPCHTCRRNKKGPYSNLGLRPRKKSTVSQRRLIKSETAMIHLAQLVESELVKPGSVTGIYGEFSVYFKPQRIFLQKIKRLASVKNTRTKLGM